MIGCTNLHQNMSTSVTHKYSELYPSNNLENYVASYFEELKLKVMDVFGDYKLSPYDKETSERLIFILKK